MKRKLVFATNNAHKLEEIAAILGDKVELLSLNDIDCHTDMILDGKEYLFEGVIKGEIIKEKRGDSGFGYDPIFKPEGYEQTFAELGNETKNKISHRALAVQKLCEFLQR